VYKGLADASGNQGLQPITTMPRLFPDPATNRFMVVFGTGKYLGAGDNGNNAMQAIMGVRDVAGTTYSQADLIQNYLHEVQTTNPDGSVTTKRCLTGKSTDTCDPLTASPTNPMPSTGAGSGGWFFNLYTTTSSGTQNNQGERVVVSPGAIFSSNTVIFETLLTGSTGSDPCNPSTQGAIMALNAVTGGPSGASSLGSWPIIGARVGNARTSGSLPLVSALGGGQVYLPGVTIPPNTPISIDAPIWRRRSWQGIQQN
jgi:type IV pilus assembly protein PilY1